MNPTVSINKQSRLSGSIPAWQVTSRVANSLSLGSKDCSPVNALISEVLPQLVYPTTATVGILLRDLESRNFCRCSPILRILFFIRVSSLFRAKFCDSNFDSPIFSFECLLLSSWWWSVLSLCLMYGSSARATCISAGALNCCSLKLYTQWNQLNISMPYKFMIY